MNMEKNVLLATTNQYNIKCPRKNKTNENKSRKKDISYYFDIGTQQIKVYTTYYFNTLSINKTPVYTAHLIKDVVNILSYPV